MTIQTWPTSPPPAFSYPLEDTFITDITQFHGMNEQANSNSRFAFHSFMVGYDKVLLASEWNVIHNFHTARRGQWDPFWFFDFYVRPWTDIYLGRGDGVTATFDLHSKSTVNDASLIILVDDVVKTAGVDYNFVSVGGLGGSDRITFIAGHIPATGALITSSFSGQLRIKARKADKFGDKVAAEDSISVANFDIEAFLIREVQW